MATQQPSDLTTIDRQWVRMGLEMVKKSFQRRIDAKDTSDTIREAYRRDLKSLAETSAKF